jgi:hypothetical protein
VPSVGCVWVIGLALPLRNLPILRLRLRKS